MYINDEGYLCINGVATHYIGPTKDCQHDDNTNGPCCESRSVQTTTKYKANKEGKFEEVKD